MCLTFFCFVAYVSDVFFGRVGFFGFFFFLFQRLTMIRKMNVFICFLKGGLAMLWIAACAVGNGGETGINSVLTFAANCFFSRIRCLSSFRVSSFSVWMKSKLAPGSQHAMR